MQRRTLIIGIVVLLCLALAVIGYSIVIAPSAQATPTPVPTQEAKTVVSATGVVVPANQATLAFKIAGRVRSIAAVGDEAQAGEVLAQLDDTALRDTVDQAEAAYRAAQANLEQLQSGARPEEIAAAQAALTGAQAQLAQVKAGAKPEQIAAAKSTLDKAEAAVRSAQADYDRVAWWGSVGASPQALTLQQASADYQAAKAAYDALLRGPTAEEVTIAQANVDRAQAQLNLLLAGASSKELAAAQAQVDEAKAALAQARAALAEAQLVAPFDGTVVTVLAREGELVMLGVPVVTLGDLTSLRVETTDLREADVAAVVVGQPVRLTFDALPGRTLTGQVTQIAPRSSTEQAGTVFKVTIELAETDPALRWGMTAYVDIEVK
jgi:HlyD family secretion protein